MSIVPKDSVEVIAQSMGINLSPDVALALAPDVEYRLREIMQEAIKCMRHSRRTRLTADDVDGALNLRNVEPIYGYVSGGPLRFKRAIGHRDLFYLDDKDVDFKDVIEAPLPKAPLDTGVVCHWLAIEGVQPAIPENAPVEVLATPSDGKKYEHKDDELPIDIKLPVKHILSRELQLYFDKITELVMSRSDLVLLKEALVSLATDSGLHPLVPYFTCFIADEVSRGLNDYPLLFALMRVVRSLLQNQHIHIEPYLHQLMPSVVTCLVSKRLGNRFADNHWELRDFSAELVASICKRFGHLYHTLQSRLTRTLVNAFLDPKRTLTQHYGAIQGLAALGPHVVHLLVLPNLESYMRLLEPQLLLDKQKNEMKRHEAWRVYGALLNAAGQCIYHNLKMFPILPSPAPQSFWTTSGRVLTTTPSKRKGSVEQIEEQPPLKKIANDGQTALEPTNSSPSHMEVDTTAPAPPRETNAGPSSSSRKMPNEGDSNRKPRTDQPLKNSARLAQVWKDDLNSGKLLISLFEFFGEDILSFIPAPEMCLFCLRLLIKLQKFLLHVDGLSFHCLLQEATFLQHHLNWQEPHPIGHGEQHPLGLSLELFQINYPIGVMIELHKQGVKDMSNLIRVGLHVNAIVRLKNPQRPELRHHLCVRKNAVVVGVEMSKPVTDTAGERFIIFHKVDNGGTI